MRLFATLRQRIDRVAKRQRHKRRKPTIIIAIAATEQPAEIVGVEGNRYMVARLAREPLSSLYSRAGALTGARVLTCAYVAHITKAASRLSPH